ncbi:MAG: DUF1592 domain-containing protein [Planctomycetota bacterium]|nr:MAG: DUF1592 domain-containing protein [Planctomycetota bacterium]
MHIRLSMVLLFGTAAMLMVRSALASEPMSTMPPSVEQLDREFVEGIRPALVQYCSDCHDPSAGQEVHFLDARSVTDIDRARSLWNSIQTQLRNRTMPPADEPQPDEETRLRIATWIETTLRATACNSGPYAGWVQTRRLNREEYQNTLHDLVGLEFDFTRILPSDTGGGEGFDNNGETLFLPPLLMERYLECAQRVVDAAILSPPLAMRVAVGELLPEASDRNHSFRRIAPGQTAYALVPAAMTGQYRVQVRLQGPPPQRPVRLQVDGLTVSRLEFAADSDRDTCQSAVTLHLPRGLHSVGVQSPNNESLSLIEVRVDQVPVQPSKQQQAAHRRITGLTPGEVPRNPRSHARQRIEHLLPLAFRRPVKSTEVDRFMQLFDRAQSRGDSFEDSLKLAVKAILVSPEFLFRIEQVPESEAITPLDDYELAVRLSYFLWSTMPDERLRDQAARGVLQRDDVLLAEADRMLEDPRSAEFFTSFVGQWLGTRDVGGRVAPTTNAIQEFYTPDIAADMRQEAVLLFQTIVQEDRSLLELIDSDYQIMTGRLAKFYEIEGAEKLIKDQFQKVHLPDRRRGGVLGLGAVLALTSHTEEKTTSPVLRGAWVLDTLLGTPVPSPPPDVPALKLNAAKRSASLREVLDQHRQATACAACHNLIDPIGIGLENFDFLGRWRDTIGREPVDATGRLPSGEVFGGPVELKQVLLRRKRAFLRQVTRKLLGYALGRSLTDRDHCTIEQIVNHLEQHEYRGGELIRQIVLSLPFRNKQRIELAQQATE